MSVHLSIVVPVYNEEESVEKLVANIVHAGEQFDFEYELILIDDGSNDSTWKIIEGLKKTTPQLKGIKFRRNYGQTSAMVAGFDHSSGEIIVTMDGDLQNDEKTVDAVIRNIEVIGEASSHLPKKNLASFAS